MSHGEKLLLVGVIFMTSADIRPGWAGAVQVIMALALSVMFVNWHGRQDGQQGEG